MDTAVLLLAFNRPTTTTRVLAAIRRARPRRLYFAVDGPRPGNADDQQRCAAVRQLASSVDWPCELHTLFREENLGCKRGVASAIDWFFQQEEEGIVLEDDVLPSEAFFEFCRQALAAYRDDPQVALISGFNPCPIPGRREALFSSYALIWGWAAWRRTWAAYDVDLGEWREGDREFLRSQPHATAYFVRGWSETFDAVAEGRVDTWDFQLDYVLMKQRTLCVVPPRSLIENIGYGPDATHTIDRRPAWAGASLPQAQPKVLLPAPRRSIEFDRRVGAAFFGFRRSYSLLFGALAMLPPSVRKSVRSVVRRLQAWRSRHGRSTGLAATD